METITLNAEYDYESKKDIAKYLAGINGNLDQSRNAARNQDNLSLTIMKYRWALLEKGPTGFLTIFSLYTKQV